MSTPENNNESGPALAGLGWWNIYFKLKFALFYQGKIGFHALENLSFAAFLLIPLKQRALNILRNIVAIPVALWLFHYDSFLPPLSRLTAQMNQLLEFETSYLIELLMRFVPASAVLSLIVLIAVYYLLSRFFRVSVVVVVALVILAFTSLPKEQSARPVGGNTAAPTLTSTSDDSLTSNEGINRYLSDFFRTEQDRMVDFSPALQARKDFDILLLSVCSLSWEDLAVTKLADHPFFSRFDVIFNQFNAATSYSGPALLRLTRASCGQPSHAALYEDTPAQCDLFENLAKLGYSEELVMNHNGEFDSLLEKMRLYGGMESPLFPQGGMTAAQKAFEGSPVYSDLQMLSRWWQSRLLNAQPGKPVAALYNTVSLHGGNQVIGEKPSFGEESFSLRAKTLFAELNEFFDILERSERDIVVVLVPEHGAGLSGDKMQIPGMREIPSPTITHIPVAVKFFGQGMERRDKVAHVEQPTSYQALAQLLDNVVEQDIYGKRRYMASEVARGLPETAEVSQNEGSTVIKLGDNHFISLDDRTWNEYPTE
ncbi:cellulose synthase operon protein YhjU [Litorivivens lipolytica]|uniref:Cellulose synthase operon protein YhjU n=1 Tax=Litorivivens lipolytica TaxID=1524264 RepID=A0A7W4W3V9_9GAMM|nr:cellulose biosynthesis protein BcsG [Litorivivens lipolytica]MBB3046971.1 cellulose synthase operon protein YhjU [Litorivivens lipolytica]